MAVTNPSSDSTVTESSLSQYDLLLGVMPLPLVAGLAVGATTTLPTVGGMGLGSLVSALLLWYSLFVAAPSA